MRPQYQPPYNPEYDPWNDPQEEPGYPPQQYGGPPMMGAPFSGMGMSGMPGMAGSPGAWDQLSSVSAGYAPPPRPAPGQWGPPQPQPQYPGPCPNGTGGAPSHAQQYEPSHGQQPYQPHAQPCPSTGAAAPPSYGQQPGPGQQQYGHCPNGTGGAPPHAQQYEPSHGQQPHLHPCPSSTSAGAAAPPPYGQPYGPGPSQPSHAQQCDPSHGQQPFPQPCPSSAGAAAPPSHGQPCGPGPSQFAACPSNTSSESDPPPRPSHGQPCGQPQQGLPHFPSGLTAPAAASLPSELPKGFSGPPASSTSSSSDWCRRSDLSSDPPTSTNGLRIVDVLLCRDSPKEKWGFSLKAAAWPGEVHRTPGCYVDSIEPDSIVDKYNQMIQLSATGMRNDDLLQWQLRIQDELLMINGVAYQAAEKEFHMHTLRSSLEVHLVFLRPNAEEMRQIREYLSSQLVRS